MSDIARERAIAHWSKFKTPQEKLEYLKRVAATRKKNREEKAKLKNSRTTGVVHVPVDQSINALIHLQNTLADFFRVANASLILRESQNYTPEIAKAARGVVCSIYRLLQNYLDAFGRSYIDEK
jgi:hypothetical protein